MPSQVAVSIIIPNYNHALYLKQRIDSVLEQTFQDFELIILDDCSTDSSRKIIELYKDHPKIVHIIYNKENSGGVFKQWVTGIKLAIGQYIWIAESDDYAAENFLEETVEVLSNDSSLGMVFTNSNIINNDSKSSTTSEEANAESYSQLSTFENIIDQENISLFLISEMIISNASSVLFRKSSLLTLDLKELQKFVNTGDRFAYVGLALNSKIKYISKSLNFMRLHEHNTTKKSFKNGNIHKDRLRVLNYYFDQIYSTSSNRKNIVVYYKTNYLSFIHFGDYKNNLEVLKNLKEKKEIKNRFYYLIRFNLYLFKKSNIKSQLMKGLYYRILVLQK